MSFMDTVSKIVSRRMKKDPVKLARRYSIEGRRIVGRHRSQKMRYFGKRREDTKAKTEENVQDRMQRMVESS